MNVDLHAACVIVLPVTGTRTKDDQASDDVATIGIALAAAVSISAADGAWELLESVTGAILVVALLSYTDRNRRRRSTPGRRTVFSGVLALCIALIASWPVQALTVKWGGLNVDDMRQLREFDDRWLVLIFVVAFVISVVMQGVLRDAWLKRRKRGRR